MALGMKPVDNVYNYLVYSGYIILAFDLELTPIASVTVPIIGSGFWFLDSNERLDEKLEDFLGSGTPPVYIGFGSMPILNSERLLKKLLAALEASSKRGLISSSWGNIKEGMIDNNCLVIGSVCHLKLFPRVAAAVHHGGAGTMAIALKAGIPQIIIPQVADQFHWAKCVHSLGVGPSPIMPHLFTVSRLAHSIKEATSNPTMLSCAKAVGERLSGSDNVMKAAIAIESAVNLRAAKQL